MEKLDCLLVELHMCLLGSWLPEQQRLESGSTRVIGGIFPFLLSMGGDADHNH